MHVYIFFTNSLEYKKCINFLQSRFPLGFNNNIYHEGNISKMQYFGVFISFLECKKCKVGLMATLSAKFVLKNAYILL